LNALTGFERGGDCLQHALRHVTGFLIASLLRGAAKCARLVVDQLTIMRQERKK
jgi:hypothetical protein